VARRDEADGLGHLQEMATQIITSLESQLAALEDADASHADVIQVLKQLLSDIKSDLGNR
jgi:hypothetical protein